MADGATIIPLRVPTVLRIVETAPAGRHVYGAPKTMPRNVGGVVYLGTTPFSAEQVERLIDFHQRIAGEEGDWRLHDAWCAARDGIEPGPEAA